MENQFQREFDSAISAARRAVEMAQDGASASRGTILRIRRIHVSLPFLRNARWANILQKMIRVL